MIKSSIEGKARVFRTEKEGKQPLYRVQLSHKNMDGTWDNSYIRIQFKKDVSVPDRTEIEIRKAWLDFFRTQNDETVFFIRCIDFEICDDRLPAWDDDTADVPF